MLLIVKNSEEPVYKGSSVLLTQRFGCAEMLERTARIVRLSILLFFLPIENGYAALGNIPLAALVSQAEVIVQGRVESILSTKQLFESSPGQIQEIEFVDLNIANLSVEKMLKGPVAIRRIRVIFPSTEDRPRYKVGELVVLFLKKDAEDDLYSTVGMLQGRYLIKDGKVEREQIPVAEFLHRIRVLMSSPSQPGR